MLPRTLEREVMDSMSEAVDYDSMDHSEVNRVFVDDFLEAWADVAGEHTACQVLDVGTGTAQIPIELCRRDFNGHVTAVDLATAMLEVGQRNVQRAGFRKQIRLQRVDAKNLPYPDGRFDAVISNSIVHHIPQPRIVLAEMARVVRPGGLLFVRDLVRPADLETVDRLVATYCGHENDHQRQMFRDSLCASLTVDEVRQFLDELGLPHLSVRTTSDRHWTLMGTPISA
ncbi:MAG TPA: class I SAM-dependent methyltransferase [Planctomycetaceae bacterium]|nr:class I SAM-dependent methyltransferase [Planctomycetaceae bacterium]